MILKTDLLPHQTLAYEKLRHLKVGALYMDMGTGKTRTALELIARRYAAGKIDNVLWLCPCSVKDGIRSNIAEHTDGADFIHIYGIESLSQSDRLYLKLLDMVSKTKSMLVVDESNLVKNHFALRTSRIQAIGQLCSYRLILNGTPISKNESDLFAQWYILDKRILGYNSFWSFAANHLEYDEYGKVRRCLNIDYLTRKIAPYSYIIKKEECLKLPEKKYSIEYFDLTEPQHWEYERVKDRLLADVNEFDSTTIYRLFTGLQQVTSGRYITSFKPLKSAPMFDNPLDNPRIDTLLDDVRYFDGEKIIIWCKYVHEIKDVQAVLADKYRAENAVLFYGDIKVNRRNEQIQRFRDKAQFLIANKTCGGYGLNLQFSHNMIYYSNDFNWATRAQSEDRVHRIGQDFNVNISDICARKKIDGMILDNLYRKENLADRFKRELKVNRNNIAAWLDGGINDKGRIIAAGKTKSN